MRRRGQMTSYEERLRISQQAAAGESDGTIATVLGCSRWTVRKWRRRNQRQGRCALHSKLGRPTRGPLSTSAPELQQALRALRHAHPGWGPATLLTELRRDEQWATYRLPSRARVAAFLKAEGLTRRYQRHSDLPQPPATSSSEPHDEWEVDAQGVQAVAGVGKVCLITVVDTVSRLKVECYPSPGTTNPPLAAYQLALRRAFLNFGLPKQLSLDHGTVFFDNTNPSPYPTRLHLWLLALGVQVRFIRVARPTDHAIIERAHQIMSAQTLYGQSWPDRAELWTGLDERRDVLNHDLPSRSLHGQASLQAYPAAIHSRRLYRPEWESDLLDLERVYDYLAQGQWFRRMGDNGAFRLGGYGYYLGLAYAGRDVAITLDRPTAQFACLVQGEEAPRLIPPCGLTREALMGELAALLALPCYQLAFPFSPESHRMLAYADTLAGTTL